MPAYMIVRVNVTDAAQYAQYTKLTPGIVKQYGGSFVIRGGEKHVLEGPEARERIVLLQFPDVESAKRMYNSAEYQAAVKVRAGAAQASFIVMEGLE